MSDLTINLLGLAGGIALATAVWVGSYVQEDVSLVDRIWGLLFLTEAAVWAAFGDGLEARQWLLLAMVAAWSIRLSGYITWRNWGEGEDKRYAAMRRKRPTVFPWRSLVTVFWLQAVLAWIIGVGLFFPMVRSDDGLNLLDGIAVAVFLVGLYFEAVGDWQLTRFLADPDNRGKVMDRGLWRYTRHPNYFGDTVVWLGFSLVSVASGAWWGAISVVFMGVMIVRVSGVALTDKVMAKDSKREGYEEYVRRTNAFFPGPRKPA